MKQKRISLQWARLINSAIGPKEANTRVVLMAIWARMIKQDCAWPSEEMICKDTRLSRNTVERHIRIAVQLGWLGVVPRVGTGKQNRLNGYVPMMPDWLEDQNPDDEACADEDEACAVQEGSLRSLGGKLAQFGEEACAVRIAESRVDAGNSAGREEILEGIKGRDEIEGGLRGGSAGAPCDGEQENLFVEDAKPKTKFDPKDIPLPDFVPYVDWCEFCDLRQEIKHPVTATAARRLIKDLTKLHAEGQDLSACLGQSISNGWRGIFATRKVVARSNKFDHLIDHSIEVPEFSPS